MEIQQITNKKQYNDFVSNLSHSELQQSWEWGELLSKKGFEILRLGFFEQQKILALITLVKYPIFAKWHYWYAPRGPVLNRESKVESRKFIEVLINNLKENSLNTIFVRIEPDAKCKMQNTYLTGRQAKCKIVESISLNPKKTLYLDLDQTEKELMKAMHQKTRYNIRLAKKNGVEIEVTDARDFDEFWKLLTETSTRDGFRTQTREHYLAILENTTTKLLLAKHQGRTIAGMMLGFFGDTAIYLHGASSSNDRNLMAPHLLQWRAIELAREMKFRFYDFHGIDDSKWPGVTRFKQGFGGEELEFAGTWDIVRNPFLYKIYILGRKIRRLL